MNVAGNILYMIYDMKWSEPTLIVAHQAEEKKGAVNAVYIIWINKHIVGTVYRFSIRF